MYDYKGLHAELQCVTYMIRRGYMYDYKGLHV